MKGFLLAFDTEIPKEEAETIKKGIESGVKEFPNLEISLNNELDLQNFLVKSRLRAYSGEELHSLAGALRSFFPWYKIIGVFLNGVLYSYADEGEQPSLSYVHPVHRTFSISCYRFDNYSRLHVEEKDYLNRIVENALHWTKYLLLGPSYENYPKNQKL